MRHRNSDSQLRLPRESLEVGWKRHTLARLPPSLSAWSRNWSRSLLRCRRFLALSAQGRVTNAKLLKPGTDSWPTFNGDYTGRRFSAADEDHQRQRPSAEPGMDVPR